MKLERERIFFSICIVVIILSSLLMSFYQKSLNVQTLKIFEELSFSSFWNFTFSITPDSILLVGCVLLMALVQYGITSVIFFPFLINAGFVENSYISIMSFISFFVVFSDYKSIKDIFKYSLLVFMLNLFISGDILYVTSLVSIAFLRILSRDKNLLLDSALAFYAMSVIKLINIDLSLTTLVFGIFVSMCLIFKRLRIAYLLLSIWLHLIGFNVHWSILFILIYCVDHYSFVLKEHKTEKYFNYLKLTCVLMVIGVTNEINLLLNYLPLFIGILLTIEMDENKEECYA